MFAFQNPLITVDSNVLVSAATISSTPPSQILDAWREERIEMALSEPILNEVQDVLCRPYFVNKAGWTKEQVKTYVNELRMGALVVPGTTKVNICRDPMDNMVLSCAIEAESEFVVSGDEDLLVLKEYKGIPIKTPRDFIQEVLTT